MEDYTEFYFVFDCETNELKRVYDKRVSALIINPTKPGVVLMDNTRLKDRIKYPKLYIAYSIQWISRYTEFKVTPDKRAGFPIYQSLKELNDDLVRGYRYNLDIKGMFIYECKYSPLDEYWKAKRIKSNGELWLMEEEA